MIDPTRPTPQSSPIPDTLSLPLGEWTHVSGWRAKLDGVYKHAETQVYCCAYTILSGDIGDHSWLQPVTWWRENMTYAPVDPIGEM